MDNCPQKKIFLAATCFISKLLILGKRESSRDLAREPKG